MNWEIFFSEFYLNIFRNWTIFRYIEYSKNIANKVFMQNDSNPSLSNQSLVNMFKISQSSLINKV